eukprot:1084638-Pelagomonas_calceolata.AAC.1
MVRRKEIPGGMLQKKGSCPEAFLQPQPWLKRLYICRCRSIIRQSKSLHKYVVGDCIRSSGSLKTVGLGSSKLSMRQLPKLYARPFAWTTLALWPVTQEKRKKEKRKKNTKSGKLHPGCLHGTTLQDSTTGTKIITGLRVARPGAGLRGSGQMLRHTYILRQHALCSARAPATCFGRALTSLVAKERILNARGLLAGWRSPP